MIFITACHNLTYTIKLVHRLFFFFFSFFYKTQFPGSLYILAGVYGEGDDENFKPTDTLDGVLIFLSNLMVFLATWLMRWGTVPVEQ